MTDNEARALGERAIAAKFRTRYGGALPSPEWEARGAAWSDNHRDRSGILWRSHRPTRTWWPDLRDAATRGAALDVVRERWKCDSLSLLYNGAYGTDSWIIVGSWPACIPIAKNAPTEAEALVSAFEAAPR